MYFGLVRIQEKSEKARLGLRQLWNGGMGQEKVICSVLAATGSRVSSASRTADYLGFQGLKIFKSSKGPIRPTGSPFRQKINVLLIKHKFRLSSLAFQDGRSITSSPHLSVPS